MKAYFEKVPVGSSAFVAFERRNEIFPFDWHYHPEFELTLIVDGCGRRFVADGCADYKTGDLVLVGPNLPHTWCSESSALNPARQSAVVVQFQHDFLGPDFFKLEEMTPVAQLLAAAAAGLSFSQTPTGQDVAKRMMRLLSLPPARRLLLLVSILCDLADEPRAKQLSAAHTLPLCRQVDQARIDTLCRQLACSFTQDINFKALASLIHMDQASLCRFFKRATGLTLTAYVTELRIAAAGQLLIETDLSLLEISYQVGFGNYSNFNRHFKRIRGFAPKFVRQQFQCRGSRVGTAGKSVTLPVNSYPLLERSAGWRQAF